MDAPSLPPAKQARATRQRSFQAQAIENQSNEGRDTKGMFKLNVPPKMKFRGNPPGWMRKLFLRPLLDGWKRELVTRKTPNISKVSDVYYRNPQGMKFRSRREIGQYLKDHNITKYKAETHFCFRGIPFGLEFEPYEILRSANKGPHKPQRQQGCGMYSPTSPSQPSTSTAQYPGTSEEHSSSVPQRQQEGWGMYTPTSPSQPQRQQEGWGMYTPTSPSQPQRQQGCYTYTPTSPSQPSTSTAQYPGTSEEHSSSVNLQVTDSEPMIKEEDITDEEDMIFDEELEIVDSVNRPPLKKRKRPRPTGAKRYCICEENQFGNMVLCDNLKCKIGCYHLFCVKLEGMPISPWYCPLCRGLNARERFLLPNNVFSK